MQNGYVGLGPSARGGTGPRRGVRGGAEQLGAWWQPVVRLTTDNDDGEGKGEREGGRVGGTPRERPPPGMGSPVGGPLNSTELNGQPPDSRNTIPGPRGTPRDALPVGQTEVSQPACANRGSLQVMSHPTATPYVITR